MKRLNFVTLGVKDLKASKKFFKTLFGWKALQENCDDVAFYDMGGWILSLYPRRLLAKDAKVPAKGSGFPGITLAHNVRRKGDVAKVLEKAKRLGGKVIKPAQPVFWGGHSGYFQDLDGHYWEIAWNPFIPILKDGSLDVQANRLMSA